MTWLDLLWNVLSEIFYNLRRKAQKFFNRSCEDPHHDRMYEVIQQLRNEEFDYDVSSSSDSISSYGYGDKMSPLSSSNNSLNEGLDC